MNDQQPAAPAAAPAIVQVRYVDLPKEERYQLRATLQDIKRDDKTVIAADASLCEIYVARGRYIKHWQERLIPDDFQEHVASKIGQTRRQVQTWVDAADCYEMLDQVRKGRGIVRMPKLALSLQVMGVIVHTPADKLGPVFDLIFAGGAKPVSNADMEDVFEEKVWRAEEEAAPVDADVAATDQQATATTSPPVKPATKHKAKAAKHKGGGISGAAAAIQAATARNTVANEAIGNVTDDILSHYLARERRKKLVAGLEFMSTSIITAGPPMSAWDFVNALLAKGRVDPPMWIEAPASPPAEATFEAPEGK